MQEAIAILEAALLDPVELEFEMVVVDVSPFAGTMSSTTTIGEVEWDVVRDAMIQDASDDEYALVSQLPTIAELQTVPADAAAQTMYITKANAKALGLDIDSITWGNGQTFCVSTCDGFFRIDDQYDDVNLPRVDLIVHEIGHALGFVSSLRFTDNLSTLDMFRLEPGEGGVNFTDARRVTDEGRVAVFYDGQYDPIAAGITGVPGIALGEIPMSTGAGGDGNQPSHFKDDNLVGGVHLGVMDPIMSATLPDPVLSPNDLSVLGLIGWDVTESVGQRTSRPGDWNTVTIGAHANDRNVQAVTENEIIGRSDASSRNDVVAHSQFLGALAGREYAADDNERLGFEIHGLIENPNDADVYAFAGIAGTEVWFDIDNTSAGLDTVISILDANGNVVASSNDSAAESADPSLLVNNGLQANHVNPLDKSMHEIKDHWTTNPKDAGFRVVLPGNPGVADKYHVQVSGDAGRGNYELQIRLRETDEIAGSSIWYSDIRYGTTGVTIEGAPLHSPLSGEAAEANIANDTVGTSQNLGNLLATDRATLSTAGRVDGAADVDFYNFEVSYNSVQQQGTGAAVMLDLDYADGIARVDTSLNVFDAGGNLIYVGQDSNIADDRPAPLNGADLDDLSRGTVGPLDPFVGSIELPVGTYSVAVAPTTQIPTELQQFNDPAAVNPLLRLEPNLSVSRIAEDHLDGAFNVSSTSEPPQFPVLIDDSALVPYHLGDVALFVTTDLGFNQTGVFTVDAFTGTRETTVHDVPVPFETGDMAIRPDGNMFAFTTQGEGGAIDDAAAGNYIQIDTGDGSVVNVGDDDVETRQSDAGGGNQAADHGMHYDAMTYGTLQGALQGFVVGHRPNDAVFPGGTPDAASRRNVLYRFDPATGEVTSAPQGDRDGNDQLAGANTDKVERGILDTFVDDLGLADKWLLTADATLIDVVTGQTITNIADGAQFVIDDGNPLSPNMVFEMNSGPEVYFTVDPASGLFVRDGDTMVIDGVNYEFNTGEVLVVDAANGALVGNGNSVTLVDAAGDTATFEFTKDGTVSGSNLPVSITNATNQEDMTLALVEAINDSALSIVASVLTNGSNRITLVNTHSIDGTTVAGTAVSIDGAIGSISGGNVINVEENSTTSEFADQLQAGFASIATIDLGVKGQRVNFAGATTADFSELVTRGVFADQGSDGDLNDPTAGAVWFRADDTADDIAQKVMNAVSTGGFTVTATGGIVELDPTAPGLFVSADFPLRVGGAGPGGDITGLTFIGTEMYAVSDAGGFFRVLDPMSNTARLEFIGTSASALQGIPFAGLTSGPVATEDGRYQAMLFGIDVTGRLHAFDTAGIPQNVFRDGASNVMSGATNIEGVHFGTLEENLWSVTADRGADAGHGLAATFDGTRDASLGGNSLHFGTGSTGTVDFPGGAHGSVESREFSLVGYTPEDRPTLYFNYFLATEDAAAVADDDGNILATARDTFRVFIGDQAGQWKLLSTNNETDDPTHEEDEVDLNLDVQVSFDNTGGWRQVRVDLGEYAGRDHLKLRFDYSTAGSMNVGDADTAGSELRVLPAAELVDGAQIIVDGETMEIDLGYTLEAPTGAGMIDGATFTVDYGAGVNGSFEIDKDGVNGGTNVVSVADALTAEQVADLVAQAILGGVSLPSIQVNVSSALESNDTLDTAIAVNLNGLPGLFEGSQGKINDNPNLILEPDADVDLYRINLQAGSTINVDTDTDAYTTAVNTYIRIFDADGVTLSANDNAAAPGEDPGTDSYLQFTAPADGDYYIGVSGAGNEFYDPTVAESGVAGSTGSYDIAIRVNTESGIVQVVNNRINLPGAVNVTETATGMRLTGEAGVTTGATPIVIHAGMNASEVANATAEVLESIFAGGNADIFKTHNEIVRVIAHDVEDSGPFGLTDALPGDAYGAFFQNLRGQNNATEGVYVDDIVVGFAERGELATNAVADASFGVNANAEPTDISTGEYQLEIRRGTQYVDIDDEGNVILVDSMDTNDRLSQSLSIIASDGFSILDGETFELSDGINKLTFEYNDVASLNGVAAGHIAIDFDASDSNVTLARRIRDLINSDAVQNVLDLTAAYSGGAATDDEFALIEPEDVRVHLFGTAKAEVVQADLVIDSPTVDANALRDVLIGEGLVAVGDAVLTSSDLSAATFSGGRTVLGMDAGIILSTGDVSIADDPNVDNGSTGTASGESDQQLDEEFDMETQDTTALEFTVELEDAGDLFLNFVFASEEYNEFSNSEFNDVLAIFVDDENIALVNGEPVSVNTVNGGNPYGANARNPELFKNNSPLDDGEYLSDIAYDGFTEILTATKMGLDAGVHHIRIAISDVTDSQFDSAVFIQANSIATTALPISTGGVLGTVHDKVGDRNTRREQGQIVIHGNHIQNQLEFGISVDASARDANGNPVAGPVRNLRELNTFSLVPGATLTNNVIASSGDGIRLAGEANAAGQQIAPVSMARVVNNTIVGEGSGSGIVVSENASPILLNNVVSGFATGIDVDATSTSVVIGGTVYHGNTTNTNGTGLGSFAIVSDENQALFVGPENGNYYPSAGSAVIDSSINSLRDRSVMTTVKQPMGIGASPVLAPETDQLGQLRVDDPTAATPNGLGINAFLDRGAIDRADFVGPRALIVDPITYDGQSADIPVQTEFEIKSNGLPEINIKLVDGVNLLDTNSGSGIDDNSIDSRTVTMTRNGNLMELGEDYLAYYDSTNDIIKLRPVSGLFESDNIYTISLTNVAGHVLEMVDGSQQPDGDSFDVTDQDGNMVTFEYDSGYTIYVRPSYTLVIPENGGAGIDDGDIVVVDHTDHGATTFEFDRDGVVANNNVAIEYTLSTTAQQIVNKLAQAMTNANVGLAPRDLGDFYLMLGSTEEHTLDATGSNLVQLGFASSVKDGESFSAVIDGEFQCFEFDTDGDITLNDNEPGACMDTEDSTTNVIEFNYSQTQDEVAEEVVTVLNEAFESLDADNYEGGIVHLGSELGMHLPTSLYESSLTITGLPGTTVDYGLTVGSVDNLTAGQTFTISSGPNAAERFEFVEDVEMVTEGNYPIVFNPDTTVESLAVTIALEIEKTDLGLQPVLLGGGNIALHGSTTAYTMDLVGTTLTQYGTAGAEANVALPFIPHESFTEQDMATMVASVIVANDDLEGITALPVDDTVEIGGAASVTGATAISYTGVQDIAGNKLQNNQIDGTTTFTLNLNSGMDHADALGYDNASHEVVSDLRLGDTVDVEPEPLANEDATGDLSDDGVTFDQMLIVNGSGLVTVTVNGVPVDAPAFLNAWLDQDGDGEFDANEKIIDSAAVTNGNQTFPFAIAEAAVSGSTIARFRLSTEEAVGPIGDAVSGEVEDYQVMIHRSGWQNPAIAEDVNYDGHVSPIDALLVINHLNVTDPVTLGQPLPIPENGNEPPPFLDVSGDNRIAPIDALMVINKLSQIVDSGGEGEFVPAVVAAISRSNVGTLTVVHDVVAEPEIDLERVREEQFSTLSLHGPELLEDVLTEIADDVRQSDLEDSDEFFANIRFE
ncbi:MAG: NF038122 family metalloprotease [Planctomycetota bacterium]|nr:NF038122 family metalloprotease [Planctomycetota bacterium]